MTVVQTQNNRSVPFRGDMYVKIVRSWIGIYKYWIATQPIHNLKGFDQNIYLPAHTKILQSETNTAGKNCFERRCGHNNISTIDSYFPRSEYMHYYTTHAPQTILSVLIFGAAFLIKCFTNMKKPFLNKLITSCIDVSFHLRFFTLYFTNHDRKDGRPGSLKIPKEPGPPRPWSPLRINRTGKTRNG